MIQRLLQHPFMRAESRKGFTLASTFAIAFLPWAARAHEWYWFIPFCAICYVYGYVIARMTPWDTYDEDRKDLRAMIEEVGTARDRMMTANAMMEREHDRFVAIVTGQQTPKEH